MLGGQPRESGEPARWLHRGRGTFGSRRPQGLGWLVGQGSPVVGLMSRASLKHSERPHDPQPPGCYPHAPICWVVPLRERESLRRQPGDLAVKARSGPAAARVDTQSFTWDSSCVTPNRVGGVKQPLGGIFRCPQPGCSRRLPLQGTQCATLPRARHRHGSK